MMTKLDPSTLLQIIVGNEYEFYSEMQQDYELASNRLRNYTGQKVTVIKGPMPKHPEISDLFMVRAANGHEFLAFEEELNGWDKALGQYFWPDGSYGPDHDARFLCNERNA